MVLLVGRSMVNPSKLGGKGKRPMEQGSPSCVKKPRVEEQSEEETQEPKTL
jgi:hypothetical protein